MDALVDAANHYFALPLQHSSDPKEWEAGIHRLQDMLAVRIVRRDYPDVWTNLEKDVL